MFHIDTKNRFLGLILKNKNKIHCSCFIVKFIVVMSVKQYLDFTKDGEMFSKVSKCNVEKICSTWKRSAMRPLSVRIMIGSEHTSWFWHLWVPLQEHGPDWWKEYILWIDPCMKEVLEDNGESTVKGKDCEDILKIKIFLKIKSNGS